MLHRVISGGQTGADQAAWRAAREAGLETGGWMPRGFRTEEGPRPEFAAAFGAVEHESPDEDVRTVANVRVSDGTLVFAGEPCSPGTALTVEVCQAAGVPCRVVHLAGPHSDETPERVASWLASQPILTLNVAGDRESTTPGIGARVEAYLAELFRQLPHPEAARP